LVSIACPTQAAQGETRAARRARRRISSRRAGGRARACSSCALDASGREARSQ
jgi:hypothetical protein